MLYHVKTLPKIGEINSLSIPKHIQVYFIYMTVHRNCTVVNNILVLPDVHYVLIINSTYAFNRYTSSSFPNSLEGPSSVPSNYMQ